MIKKISLILMLAFSQIYGKIVIDDRVEASLDFLKLCLRYVESNGLDKGRLKDLISSIKGRFANCTFANFGNIIIRPGFHNISDSYIYADFQWSDSPQLILATDSKFPVTINCSTCHNWDLKMLKSMVDFSVEKACIYCESQTGQTLLIDYTILNKIEHVKYLLSLNTNHKMLDKQVKVAFQIACKSGNGELIQLFQNYFEKQRLNLQIAELQNTLHNLQTIASNY